MREPDWTALGWRREHQLGLVTRQQCLEAGLTLEAIRWRLETGQWVRIHPGVYQTRPGATGWEVTATAAFLAVQSGRPIADAAWGGRTAARVLGLTRADPQVIDLVVPRDRHVVAPEGVSLTRIDHWFESLEDIPYPWRTTPALTVLQCAALGDEEDALRWITDAVRRRDVSVSTLTAELRFRGRHRHGRFLREVLAEVAEGAQSPAEVRYIRDVERAHGLPSAIRQYEASGGRYVHDNL